MHLLLIAGFLGTGKTTFSIQVATECIRQGRKVAMLVNEIGEIGIDGQLMRELDLDVWEMSNGCICCTLAADLVPTLEKLDQEYAVDLILMEPSGAADPESILRTLVYYKGRPLESIYTVTLLDPLRLPELYEVVTPLIVTQIANANVLFANKADLATAEQLEDVQRIATEVNPDAKLLLVSARQGIDSDLLKEILPWKD
ncbi:MAG: GTP-binding protein [Firmicutes bacterium]|nr:GTP-binding protein [Bacillota bacterium]